MANFSVYKSAAAVGAASAVGAAGAAQAQSVETGMYGGLTYAVTTSGQFGTGIEYDFNSGNIGGIVGFNYVMDAMVLGFELGLSHGPDIRNSADYDPLGLVDVRFRFGQQFGDLLVYLTAGGSTVFADWYDDGEMAQGASFGGGVEYTVMENAFIGLDVNARSLVEGSSKYSERPLVDATVRLGFRW